MKGVKCYRCQRTGHIARNCTESKSKSSFRVGVDCPEATESSDVDQVDELRLHTVVSASDAQVVALQVAMKGPTYKVDIVVEKGITGQ